MSKIISRDHSGKICSFHYEVWIYNLWTEEWRKYAVPEQKGLPISRSYSGVVIRNDIYIFGENMFGKLTSKNGLFVWSMIHPADQAKVPSPRVFHCAWEHGEKMWVFGGFGLSPVDYLNDHGEFILLSGVYGNNNQLLSYDPSTDIWTNVKCSGEVPSPRNRASSAKMHDNIWLCGGETGPFTDIGFNDVYKLNMHSFVWTKIETTLPLSSVPSLNCGLVASLTPISASQLLWYEGNRNTKDIPRIFDVQSHTWTPYPIAKSHHKCKHTGITGLNSNVIILGKKILHQVKNLISVTLEPKCLQQQAIQMIYKHRSNLPWKMLPQELISKMGLE